jgi:hypothetical protein
VEELKMDEATKQALNQFVQDIVKGAQATAHFAVEQTPLVVQEWLNWIFWSNLINGLLGIGVILFLAYLAFLWAPNVAYTLSYNSAKSSPYCLKEAQCGAAGIESKNVARLAGGVVWVFVNIFAASATASYLLTALKVVVAPRVVLLEQFANLLK